MQHKELGRFLRTLRERTPPRTEPPPGARKRRTPGLRREELADLCGISATWYTWIEQGRAPSVSHEVLARLAHALDCTDAQRRYLWEIAGLGPVRGADSAAVAPPAIVSLLQRIDAPAYCLGRYWDALAWNQRAARLFPDWLGTGGADRNLLGFVFCEPSARTLIVDWERRARRLIAEFVADASDLEGADRYQELVARLSARSEEFHRYWRQQEVWFREPAVKHFRHPRDGLVSYEQTTFSPLAQRDLKLVVLNPEDCPARKKGG
ncbi:MAG TPA: helix-turn-helix transcriptional regulator [Acidiferrobacter sp.]|nr:helix-turn-helix transcriptional regulator [Acidiferrobacter sp.]